MAAPLVPQILDALPTPILAIDRSGSITAANPAALALLGDWVVGRNYVTALRQPALLSQIEASISSGQGGRARFIQSDQTGQTVFAVTVSVLDTAEAAGLLLHFEDVTHLREAQEMRRDFVANVSHELKTPLTAILGFIETLRGPARDDPGAQSRFLNIMEDEARRMNRIVSDLLSLSRVEGQERMRPDDTIALDELMRSVAAALRPQAEDAGCTLELDGVDTPVVVRGDKDQLMQVLVNLAENAIKYGGANGPVTLRLTKSEGRGSLRGPVAQIEVIDVGDGIDPIHLPRLTERFYRVDTHRSRAMGGTGLGLAIVKHIVNRHRGKLKITSEAGKGSVFTVLLPIG